MIVGFHISQQILAIDLLTALKSSLEQRREHVLQLLRLYEDQALKYTRVLAVLKSVMRRKWSWIPYHLLRSSTCRIAVLANCKY